MKKTISLLNCIIISGALVVHAQNNTSGVKVQKDVKSSANYEAKKEEKKPAADILWINESTHDFGKIPQGKPVMTEFNMKNLGKDSLKLESVRAGCGCTTPVWSAGPYAAGENFKITVGYNAASEGIFTKPVTITYNGGQQKVINITGTVYTTPPTSAPKNNAVEKLQN